MYTHTHAHTHTDAALSVPPSRSSNGSMNFSQDTRDTCACINLNSCRHSCPSVCIYGSHHLLHLFFSSRCCFSFSLSSLLLSSLSLPEWSGCDLSDILFQCTIEDMCHVHSAPIFRKRWFSAGGHLTRCNKSPRALRRCYRHNMHQSIVTAF